MYVTGENQERGLPLQHKKPGTSPVSGKTPTYLYVPDRCMVCDDLIASNRQIDRPGTDVCERCAGPGLPGAA